MIFRSRCILFGAQLLVYYPPELIQQISLLRYFPPIFSPPLWFNELHWCNKYTTRLHHVARFHKRLEKINAFWKWKSSWLGILLWVLNKKFLCNDKKHNTITLTYLELLAVYIWPELLETNKPVGSWSQASIHYY